MTVAAPHKESCFIGAWGCFRRDCFNHVKGSDVIWYIGHWNGEGMLSCPEHKDEIWEARVARCDCRESKAI